MKNIDIYETIYNVDLAVCNKKCTDEDIINNFYDYKGNTLTKEYIQKYSTAEAYTIRCIAKKTNNITILVRIMKVVGSTKLERDINLINSITHEAMHVVLDTFYKMNEIVSTEIQEPYAYYIGWISECIYKSYKK